MLEDPEARRQRNRRAQLLVAFSGLALALAQAPLSWALVAWFACVPLFRELLRRDCTWRHAARCGLLFGFCYHTGVLHWIVLLHPISDATRTWMLLPGVAGLAAFFAFPWLVLSLLVVALRRRLGSTALLLVPLAFPIVEWLQARGPWAFPWSGLAATQVEFASVLQTASLTGSLGLTACVLAFNVAMTWWSTGVWRLRHVVGVVLVLALIVIWGTHRARRLGDAWDVAATSASTLVVTLVQPNVAVGVKWDARLRDYSLERLAQATRHAIAAGAHVVVWPETAIPDDLLRWPSGMRRVEQLARRLPLLAGFPHRDAAADGAARNAVALFERGALHARYDKSNLLPWGERAPSVLSQASDGARGTETFAAGDPAVLLDVQHTGGAGEAPDMRAGVLVCFEVAFAARARAHRRAGATLLLNPVNDGWFGNSAGPHQHAALARLRAVETGLPLLRCANNGISYACAPNGELRGRAALARRGIVQARLPPAVPPTLYTRTGDLPLLCACGLGIAMMLWFAFKPRASAAAAGAPRSP